VKVVTLNIWGGRVAGKLEGFFHGHGGTDIFCFQEVFHAGPPIIEHARIFSEHEHNPDLFEALKRFLPGHRGMFCQAFRETYGVASFLKNGIKVLHHGETMIARGDWDWNDDIGTKDHHRKIQWIELEFDGRPFLLANAHLTHRPEGKRDSEKRIRQSRRIADFLAMFDCPKVLVGDFNLMPDTESIRIIEAAGMKNLVKEHGVTCTRTELYRRFATGPKFADYIFVSPDVRVREFKVLEDVVSDHSPLYLDFDFLVPVLDNPPRHEQGARCD
jgi:endonuclease/exonuclease/phosphatase family metal-dependent hydrolase